MLTQLGSIVHAIGARSQITRRAPGTCIDVLSLFLYKVAIGFERDSVVNCDVIHTVGRPR